MTKFRKFFSILSGLLLPLILIALFLILTPPKAKATGNCYAFSPIVTLNSTATTSRLVSVTVDDIPGSTCYPREHDIYLSAVGGGSNWDFSFYPSLLQLGWGIGGSAVGSSNLIITPPADVPAGTYQITITATYYFYADYLAGDPLIPATGYATLDFTVLPPPTATLTAVSPIDSGQTTNLHWTSTNTNVCAIYSPDVSTFFFQVPVADLGDGTTPSSVLINTTTTNKIFNFILSCWGGGSNVTPSVPVTVRPSTSTHTLTVTPTPTHGYVTSADGFNCGSGGRTTCQKSYSSGDQTTLIGHPDSGYYLERWSVSGANNSCTAPGGCSITMGNQNATAAATFTALLPTTVHVTINTIPTNGSLGTLDKTTNDYLYGIPLTITATPINSILAWSDDCAGATGNSCTLDATKMQTDKIVTATFSTSPISTSGTLTVIVSWTDQTGPHSVDLSALLK